MQLLKISFLLALSISLYSFAFNTETKKESVDEQLYKEFLKKFKTVKLPATLALKNKGEVPQGQLEFDMAKEEKARVLGSMHIDFIPEIEYAMVSRTAETTYQAEVLLESTTAAYNSVIYSTSDFYGYNFKSYYLATFDKKGSPISQQLLGNSNGKIELKVEVSSNLAFVIKELEPSKTSPGKYAVIKTNNLSVNTKGEISAPTEGKANTTKSTSTKTKTTPAVKG